MAALTGSRNTPELSDGARIVVYGLEASTSIFLGGMVALNAAGNAVPPQSSGVIVVGRAEYVYAQGLMPSGIDALNQSASAALFPQIPNLGAAGAIGVGARKGVFNFDNDGSITAANAGQICFAVDDHTVSATDGSGATAVSAEAHTLPADPAPLVVQVTHGVNISGVVVKNSTDSTTYVLGTDYYIVDAAHGIIGFMGATLVAGAVVHISYNYGAPTRPAAGKVIYVDALGVWVDFWHQSAAAL